METATEGHATFLRRSLAVPPGAYDLYIALLERDQKGTKKWALLKPPITIPDMSTGGLRISSVIVTDRIEPLARPVTVAEQPASLCLRGCGTHSR